MPDFLMLHLKKFTLREDWVSIKLDVAVEIPDIMDLSDLRGTGLMGNEELLPELSGRAPTPPPMDQNVIQQLVSFFYVHFRNPLTQICLKIDS
jgi:ubiquitin carboxyl-terminal hydrolase 5/13